MIFLLAQINSACIVSEEYLDAEFSYLRDVLVLLQGIFNRFMVNDFINFLEDFSAI